VTPGARCGAKALDDLKRFPSFQALNDAPERAGQPADILVEGKVLFSRGHRHSKLNYAARREKLIPARCMNCN